MNTTILPPAMEKIVGSLALVWQSTKEKENSELNLLNSMWSLRGLIQSFPSLWSILLCVTSCLYEGFGKYIHSNT